MRRSKAEAWMVRALAAMMSIEYGSNAVITDNQHSQNQPETAQRSALPSPGDIARGRNYTPAEQGQSYMRGHAQGNIQTAQVEPPSPGGFAQREIERQKPDADPLQRGRVLPDEQLENNKGRDR